jgi:L-arabinose isomerase
MDIPRIPRRKPLAARIGVFGVGFHAYWPQFDGLLDELLGKLDRFVGMVQAEQVEVVNFGMVDDAESAYALLPRLKAADLDLVFCDMLTYATSASFAAIARGLDVPIVLVALQPLAALDYSRASTYMQLCNDDFCSVPEFTGVAIRMGRKAPPVSWACSTTTRRPGPRSASGARSPRCCTTCNARASGISGTPSSTCWTCRPTRRR